MTTKRVLATTVGVAVGLAVLCGCVLREETIKVARDGAVTIELEITGGVAELTDGDAMPSAETGWKVERHTGKDEDGEKLSLKTVRRFGPGDPLPRTFAAPDDPDADLYLDFPTEVNVERRPDGMYYTFHRTYTPRNWAQCRYWQDVIFDDKVKALGDKPVEELTRKERRTIIQAFAGVEALKQIEFARAGLRESLPDTPIAVALQARAALLGVYASHVFLSPGNPVEGHSAVAAAERSDAENAPDDLDELIERCDGLGKDERDACYEDEAQRLFDEALGAYSDVLASSGVRRSQLQRFEESYRRAKRRFELTDAIGGHGFVTKVVLPGTMIADNAVEIETDAEAGQVTAEWQYYGNAFRDRRHELWAVSKVSWNELKKMRGTAHGDRR